VTRCVVEKTRPKCTPPILLIKNQS
jgi:hypothetical protein